MAHSWLIIERLENWEADKAEQFSMFGLSNRYKNKADRIEKDDLIFCYVSSGISAFSDIRIVQIGGLKPLRRATAYDSAFAYYIATAPLLILERERWLPIKHILADLDLTKGRAEWRPMFRTSLRSLTEHDAQLLKARLEKSADSS